MFNINLNSIEKVRVFASIVELHDGDVDARQGRYVIDAKSIMGLFSLSLINPVTIEAIEDEEGLCEKLREKGLL